MKTSVLSTLKKETHGGGHKRTGCAEGNGFFHQAAVSKASFFFSAKALVSVVWQLRPSQATFWETMKKHLLKENNI
jgi:hypothetical protein